MIRTLFHSMQELGKGARRPTTELPTDVRRLGVLGAGVMGQASLTSRQRQEST
jgi:3-hydroxyacyl-CoA dehydrogenase/enoyl-CoA hydratase/3-hydroxybutyryl-CoA epimerase